MRHLPRSPRFLVLFCNNQSKVAIGSSPPIVHICVNSLESAGLPAPATNAILQPVTDWTNRWAIPGCVHRSPQTSCARCLETRWADRGKSAAVRRPGDCFQHGSRPPLSGYLAPPPQRAWRLAARRPPPLSPAPSCRRRHGHVDGCAHLSKIGARIARKPCGAPAPRVYAAMKIAPALARIGGAARRRA